LAPIFLFVLPLNLKSKLILFVALALTDIFDGMIARLVKNKSGMGKIIDSTADKVMIFSGLLFLYAERIISSWVAGIIFFGEVLVLLFAVYGISLSFRKNVSRVFKINNIIGYYHEARKEILNNWNVNIFGKITIDFYFLMSSFIFFRSDIY